MNSGFVLFVIPLLNDFISIASLYFFSYYSSKPTSYAS